jgi:hypothetical protein
VWEGGLDSITAVSPQRSAQISCNMCSLSVYPELISEGCMLGEEDGLRLTQDNCISAAR